MLDLRSTGREFESRPLCCRVQPWASCEHTCASVTKQYNLVPASGWWCLAAGKVTVGLASHWPRVTDVSGSLPTGSRPRRGRWAPPNLLAEYDELYPFLLGHAYKGTEVSRCDFYWRTGAVLAGRPPAATADSYGYQRELNPSSLGSSPPWPPSHGSCLVNWFI